MDKGEMKWLAEENKSSIIIIKYSFVPYKQCIIDRQNAKFEPLIISKEISGWYLLVRVLGILYGNTHPAR